MSFLIRQTLIYAIPLMIVALAGIFAERSGVINLALEGIMIFGAFIGVLFVRILQATGCMDIAKEASNWAALQGYMFLTMLAAAALVLTLKTYVPAVDALLARAAAAAGETHAVQAFSELTRRLSGGEGVQQALSGSFEILTGGN